MISDPFLRHLIEEATKRGQFSQGEMDPATWMRPPTFHPGMGPLGDAAAMQGPPAPEGLPPTPDPIESQLMALLHRQPSFMDRLGPIPQPAMPRSSNERDVGGRSLLSGLVGGFNSGLARGQGQRQPDSQIARLLQIQEMKRLHDAQIGHYGATEERLAGSQAALEKSRAALDADRDASRAGLENDRALRHGETGQRITLAFDSNNMAHDRLKISKAAEARRAALDTARLRWPPQMNKEYESRKDELFLNARSAEKAGTDYDLHGALDDLNSEFLLKQYNIPNIFNGPTVPESLYPQAGATSTAPKSQPVALKGKKAAPAAKRPDPAGIF